MWIKYKHRFAWGVDKDWSYIEIPNDWKDYGYDHIHEFLDEEMGICKDHEGTDKYRGFDWKRVDKLPESVIIKKIKNCQNSIIFYTEQIKKLEEML